MDTFIERLGNLPNSQLSSGKHLGPGKRISQEQKDDSNLWMTDRLEGDIGMRPRS